MTSRPETRTPAMLQVQEADCGAVALWMVLAWHGAWVPLPDVRERSGVTRFGVNAAGLMRAAGSFGLKARAVRLDATQLAHISSPTIVFWQQSHFLVLERVSGDRAWVNDPAVGHRELSLPEFAAGYSGIAFPMSPGDTFLRQGTPPRHGNEAGRLAKPARASLAGLALLAIVENVLLALAAFWLGQLVDQRQGDAASVIAISGIGVGLAVAVIAQGILSDRAIGAIAGPTRRQYLDDLAALPAGFVEVRRAPELAGRLRLPETAAVLLASLTTSGSRLVAAGIAWSVVLGQVSWLIAVAFVAGVAVAGVMNMQLTVGVRHRAGRQHHEEGGRIADVSGMWARRNVIRANGEEAYELQLLTTMPAPLDGPAAAAPSRLLVVPVAVSLPAMVACMLAAVGDITAGGLVIAACGTFAAIRLARQPVSVMRDAGMLPYILRQLDDSRAEAAWRQQRQVAA